VGDPEGRDRRDATLGVGLSTLVDGARGRVEQVGLDDVAGDVELLVRDLLAVDAVPQGVARAPDRVGVAALDRLLRDVRDGRQTGLGPGVRRLRLVFDFFAAASRESGSGDQDGNECGGTGVANAMMRHLQRSSSAEADDGSPPGYPTASGPISSVFRTRGEPAPASPGAPPP